VPCARCVEAPGPLKLWGLAKSLTYHSLIVVVLGLNPANSLKAKISKKIWTKERNLFGFSD
jgi:hypothetical protein